jgi:hypothetical protein
MGAFAEGTKPPCKEITMEVIDVNNQRSQETHFVTLSDINSLEGFSNYNLQNAAPVDLPKDIGIQLYYMTLSGLGLYLLYKLMNK